MKNKSLTLQLEELYNEKWGKLLEQLEQKQIKVKAPFLLSVDKYDEEDYRDESWYTDADLKVMIFGQEANRWEWKDKKTPADVMENYQVLYHDDYTVDDSGTIAFVKQGSRFLCIGFNGFSSQISEHLHNEMPNRRVTFLWNNISKLSAVGRDGVSGIAVNNETHEIEREFFHVIPDEIEILKPDVLIFLTGVTDKYNEYIRENFNVKKESVLLDDYDTRDLAKLDIAGVKLAYRTHHPASRIDTSEETWTWYHAILDDIKKNLDTIFQ